MRFLSLLLIGCAATAPTVEGPEDVVRAYSEALARGDAAALHALMNEESQQTTSPEEIGRLLTENREELNERASHLNDRVAEGVESRASVRLPNGELAVLRLEGGVWKIDGGVVDAPTLQTPEDAIRSLRRALMRRSLRRILRVLARAPRAEIEAEIERFLEDTEDELDLEAEIQGNEAFIRSSSGRVIRLLREAGEWRIADVE
ncbi:MAG: hypothetical protein AAGE52_13195 [Myxococcota bacterium]